jgi:hypothetical protein
MKKYFIFPLAMIILALLFPINAYAADQKDSIQGDYFNKVFVISPNDGSGIFDTPASIAKRKDINNQILTNKTNGKTYSLFDRFGPDISFVPYLGETKIKTSLLDRFYTNFKHNDEGKVDLGDDVKALFEGSAISNNQVYTNRPDVLSKDDISSGNEDPRVYAYSGINSTAGDAALGNAYLSIAKVITSVTSWMSGSGLYNSVNDALNKVVSSGFLKTVSSIVQTYIPILIALFLIRLVMMGIKFAKGDESATKIIRISASAIISLSIILVMLVNPMVFNNSMNKFVTSFDNIFDSALNVTGDEVVKSDSNTNIREASLWEKTVFEPWTKGMFNRNYNQMYTQFDKDKNHTKLPQSHDDVKTSWTNGKKKYDSADLTGDINVPVGNGKNIKNWAALAWSTQSVYHLDAVEDKDQAGGSTKTASSDNTKTSIWPVAKTTPMNTQIFVDNFRWIDAFLNISPEYTATDKVNKTYSNANGYTEHFTSGGFNALYRSILLLPILLLAFKKLRYSIEVVLSGFKLLMKSMGNLISPDRWPIGSNLKELFHSLYYLFWWTVMIFVSITLYITLIDKGGPGTLLWLILGIYMFMLSPVKVTKTGRKIKSGFKSGMRKVTKRIKGFRKA